MAERYDLDPKIFDATVARTCMPPEHSREEFIACMLVAHQYQLNPFTKEIHFARDKYGKMNAMVGVDGWITIINRQPQFDGLEIAYAMDEKGRPVAATCTIHRKDRSRPTVVTEFLDECKRDSAAWKLTPSRMLRHRAIIQCARLAFGLAGIMEDDEFARWQEQEQPKLAGALRDAREALNAAPASIDIPDLPDDAAPAEDPPIADPEKLIAEMTTDMAAAKAAGADISEVQDQYKDLIARLPEDFQADAYAVLELEPPQ
jgi:phage recombination protein Bet